MYSRARRVVGDVDVAEAAVEAVVIADVDVAASASVLLRATAEQARLSGSRCVT